MPNLDPIESTTSRAKLIEALLGIVSGESVLFDKEDLKPYECDGLSAYQTLPLLVELPGSIDQVQAIMRLCRQHHVPVVKRGAGTGLSVGALPHANGILLSLAKFKNIIHVNPKRRIVKVQPGVHNLAISQAAGTRLDADTPKIKPGTRSKDCPLPWQAIR